MKRTAAELSEIIAVVASVERSTVRVQAVCPVCTQLFGFSTHKDIEQMKALTLSNVITHLRLAHPDE
jgi:hypothetical protein